MGSAASVHRTHGGVLSSEQGRKRPPPTKYPWDVNMTNLEASDIKDITHATIEIKRIRKIAKSASADLALGQHICAMEGDRLEDNMEEEASLEKVKHELINLRKLFQHIRRTNSIFHVFQKIDKDHNNFITESEMQLWLGKYKKKIISDDPTLPFKLRFKASATSVDEARTEAKKIFDKADYTFDHQLDFHEFFEYVNTLFHAAFDKIDADNKDVIDSSKFGELLEFIYGKNLGVSSHMKMTTSGKAFALKRATKQKILEMEQELKGKPITRGVFIDYLIHCYEDHHQKDLYYNLMELSLQEGNWTQCLRESQNDIKRELKMERADAEIAEVETVDYARTKTKRHIEDQIIDTCLESPKTTAKATKPLDVANGCGAAR